MALELMAEKTEKGKKQTEGERTSHRDLNLRVVETPGVSGYPGVM